MLLSSLYLSFISFLISQLGCGVLKLSPSHFLSSDSLSPRDYNSYGSRRGNDDVMARGTFANIRLFNKFLNKQAPQTIHLPTGETVSMQHLRSRISLMCLLQFSLCQQVGMLLLFEDLGVASHHVIGTGYFYMD